MAYVLALFLHVAFAMALFAGLGIEGATLLRARRAEGPTEPAGSSLLWAQRLAGPGLGGTVLVGLYLAGTTWGWRVAWIDLAIAGVLLVGAVWGTMTGARLARLHREGHAGPLADPVLWWSFTTRTGLLVGIVFLMTVKPGLAVSLIALAVALAAGLLAGRPRRQGKSAAA